MAKWRGDRAASCTLPVEWAEHGIYGIAANGHTIRATIKKTGEARHIPKDRLPQTFDTSDMHIDRNFSRTTATLYFAEGIGGLGYKLSELFPLEDDHILECYKAEFQTYRMTKGDGKCLKALEDGGLHTPRVKRQKPLCDGGPSGRSLTSAGSALPALALGPGSEHGGESQAPVEGEQEEEAAGESEQHSEGVDERNIVPPAP